MKKPRGKGAHPGVMRVAALSCLLLAVFCGPAAAGEWQTYLEDTFSSPETMFHTGQAGEAFYAIDQDGRYIIDGMNTSSDSLSALTEDLYYYYLEGKCELLRSTAGELAFTGLVFHYNKSIPGKLSYYVFYYYGDGYYGAKRVVGDQVDIIIPLTPTDALDMYGVNVLGVDAQGTRFDLYINNRYVDGFTDVRIDGGGFGFYISKYSKSAFDDFTVKVERRGGGLETAAAPVVAEGGNVADNTGGTVESGSRDFPEIPRDPGRPVYSWEVGVNKTGKPRPGDPEPEPEPEVEPEAEPESSGDGGAATENGSGGSSEPAGDNSDSDGMPPGVIASASLRSASEPAPQAAAPAANVRPPVTGAGEPEPEPEPEQTAPVIEPVEALDPADIDLPPGEEMMTGTRELKNPQAVNDDEKLVVYTLPAADDGIGESLDVSPVTREEIRAAAPRLPAARVPDVEVEYTDLPDPESSERLARFIEVEPDRVNGSAVTNTTGAADSTADDTAPVETYSPPLSLTPAAGESTATSNYSQTDDNTPGDTVTEEADDENTAADEERLFVLPPRDELILLTPEDDDEPEDEEPEPAPLNLTPRGGDASRDSAAAPQTAESSRETGDEQAADEEEARRIADRMRSNDSWDDDDVVVDYRIASALENDGESTAAPAEEPGETAEEELKLLPAAEERNGSLNFGAHKPEPGPLDLHGDAATADRTELTGDEIALSLTPRGEPTAAQPAARPFYAGPDLIEINDDFSTQRWPESTGGPTSYRYFGAAYEISNIEAQTMAISFQEAALADLEILADVEFLEGQSFVGYGLAARFTVVNGLTSYYGLFISESGEFLLLKVAEGREQVLVDWTASTFIQANRENRIGLDLRGDRITAYINGLEVAAITDGSLKAGGYALLAGPAVAARFDNLEIRGFEH